MSDANGPNQLAFEFEYDPAYRIVPANMLWGGFTLRGDFKLDFVLESFDIPQKVVHPIIDGGRTIGAESERVPPAPGRLIRRLMVGVTIPVNQLESLALFFNERVAQMRALQAQAASAQETTNVPPGTSTH